MSKSPLLMTQQYRNFILRFTAYLFIKLLESEMHASKTFGYS